METIVKPKNKLYDIACANHACGAVLRCDSSELTYQDIDTLSYQYRLNCGAGSSVHWALQCPHCRAVTKVFDLLKHEART